MGYQIKHILDGGKVVVLSQLFHNNWRCSDNQVQLTIEDILLCSASCHGQPGCAAQNPKDRLTPGE